MVIYNPKATTRPGTKDNGRGGWAPDYPAQETSKSGVVRYPKPAAAPGLPKWFLDIRAGSEFMPAKVKPVSYNYMSLVETPNRQGLYGAAGAVGSNNMNIGIYNKPTDDVAKGIKTNYNIARDMQNLGQEPPHGIKGFFQRAIDVLSRPLYSIMNVHLNNVKMDYMTPQSAGGQKVTFGEHIQALLDDFTPIGLIKDISQGQMDDRLAAGWAGLSGKEKTTTHTILEQEYPGFTAAHPKLAIGASIVGDLAFDPLTWVSVGASGPGSVLKSIGAASLGVAGRKAAAKAMLEETLLTRTGREAGKEALRVDRFNAEYRKINRTLQRLGKQGDKIVAGKKTRLELQDVAARISEAIKQQKNLIDNDLKGAAFARSVFKGSIPTLGINTLSKLNLGASHWRKVQAATSVADAERIAKTVLIANEWSKENHWKKAYASMQNSPTGKPKDITYTTPNGNRYTVKLSEAKDFDEWLYKIAEESGAVAKIAEPNTKAARSRGARIQITEARARAFREAFSSQFGNRLGDALDPKAGDFFDKLRASKDVVYGGKKIDPEFHAQHPEFVKITEDELYNHTYESLFKDVKEAYKKQFPKDRFTKNHHRVIVVDDNGVHRIVNMHVLRKTAADYKASRLARQRAVHNIAVAAKAGDAAPDEVRVAQQRVLDAFDEAEKLGHEYTSSVLNTELKQDVLDKHLAGMSDDAKNVYINIRNAVSSSSTLDDATKSKLVAILQDTSIPMEERIKKILSDTDLTNPEFASILNDSVSYKLENGELRVVLKGNPKGANAIQGIMNTVIKQRLEERIGPLSGDNIAPMLREAGIRITEGPGGKLRIESLGKEGTNFSRDLHGEIGMALLDAHRYALEFARRADLFKDPEYLFNEIRKTVDDFINTQSADFKRQVFQLMFNLTGKRLPEDFVPTIAHVENTFPRGERPTFQFLKADGTPANQQLPWQNLVQDMQRWVLEPFHMLHLKPLSETKGSGFNLEDAVRQMEDFHNATSYATDEQATAVHLLENEINKLQFATFDAPINGVTPVVNRYSMLDYLLYDQHILDAHNTTLHVTKNAAGKRTTRISQGRLSALDSYAFVDDEVKAGLEAVGKLKKLMKDDNPEMALYAQQSFINLFAKNDGVAYLAGLEMPADLDPAAHIAFGDYFNTLGIHVRLKQDVVSTKLNSLNTKHRADLMDHFWGTQSLNHEWQKAMQNSILYDHIMDGKTVEMVVQDMSKNLDDFFEGYTNLKKLMHPFTEAGQPIDTAKLQQAMADLKAKQFGGKQLDVPASTFGAGIVPGFDASKIAPGNVAFGRVNVERIGADVGAAANLTDEDISKMAKLSQLNKELGIAQREEALSKDAFVTARQELTNQRKIEANTSVSGDPADFANVGANAPEYTAKDMDRIREWIAASYTDKNPQELAKELHGLSMSISSDMAMAQGRIIAHLADFNIKHGANFRVMGVPLMNLMNPQNMTHSIAGVTAFEQETSSARRFFRNQMDTTIAEGRRRNILMEYRRRSQVINEGLDHINANYANAASMTRRHVIQTLNELFRNIHKGEYVDPAVGALKRKEKIRLINNQLFNPATAITPGRLDMFKLADGTNPVQDIVEDFSKMAPRIVNPQKSQDVFSQIKLFNRYVHEKYRLSRGDIEAIERGIDRGEFDGSLVPYTTDWIRAVGKYLPKSKLGTDKLLETNIGEFQYALHDGILKLNAGAALHQGVFDEFAAIMKPADVEFHNTKVLPHTVNAKGEQMRGKLINIDDIVNNPHYGINPMYIPDKFRKGNYYISEDILPEIRTLFEYMDKSHTLNDSITASMMDKVLNYFKASVTIYNIPTYPIRNLLSDVFLSAMDGVINPRHYSNATKIIWSQRQDMKNMNPREYEQILDQNFFKEQLSAAAHDPQSVMNPAVNPNSPVRLKLKTQAGMVEMNDAQIYHVYEQMGLGQNRVSGDIPQSVAAARQTRRGAIGGGMSDAIRTSNDIREDWGRMAHFLHAIESEAPLGGNLNDILRRAGDRVKKYHFDYSDVSLFDRKVLARWIPFYKWTKNIIPFTLAHVVMTPKFLGMERAASKTAGVLMQDDTEYDQDFIIADFIKHDVPVPIGVWSDPNGYKFQQFALMYLPLSTTMTGVLSPVLDPWVNQNLGIGDKALASGAGVAIDAASMSNPVVKAGIQAVTNKVVYPSGAKPEGADENWAKTLGQIIPGWAASDSFTRSMGPFMEEGTEGKSKSAQLAQLLGAVRVYNNNEAVQKGQNKKTEDLLRSALNRRKAEILTAIKRQYPGISDADAQAALDEWIKGTRKQDAARL